MKFLLILILPMVISGYEWTPPQLVGSSQCGYSRFALDCFGNLWCIFNVYASPCTLKASYYLDSLWVEPMSVYAGSQASGVGGFDATRAKDGKLWVLVCEEGIPEYYTTIYYDGSIWSDTFILPICANGGTGLRLAADSIGKVWAVFSGFEDYRIWCDVCEDTIWSGPYVVCSYPNPPYVQVMSGGITIDPNGIRWVGGTALLWPNDQIFLTHSDSTGAWTNELTMAPQIDSGSKMLRDIIADNNGNIWIAWCNSDEDRIYTAYLDTNLTWSTYYQITQSSGEFYGWSKMAVDGENKVWIVYDKDSTFYYRVWNGVDWSPEETIVAPPASSAFHGDIFYDSVRDRIWVSFKYGTGYAGDIYVTWTNTAGGVIEHEVQNGKNSLLIYPTPAKDNIFINTQNKESKNIKIFDCLGRVVKTFITAEKVIIWNCLDNNGKMVEKGVYFIKIDTENSSISEKIIVL
jgi:hypothetical protein